eukprot:scaffold42473_cov18-Tisochrysis_lutea.AAC.2
MCEASKGKILKRVQRDTAYNPKRLQSLTMPIPAAWKVLQILLLRTLNLHTHVIMPHHLTLLHLCCLGRMTGKALSHMDRSAEVLPTHLSFWINLLKPALHPSR